MLGTALLVLCTAAVMAEPQGYPRIAAHTYNSYSLPPDQQERIAAFDLLSTREPPERIAEIRAGNPNIRILYRHMPQFIPNWDEGETFWHADTAWCLLRLCQYYVMQNDWFLYDTSGERIPAWTGYATNWTRYCPEGTYGTATGLTYAEWYTDVAIPQITQNSPYWERWGWGSSAYDGIAWEVLCNCPHCCVEDQYLHADPDLDGLAEGIQDWCWSGGNDDSLSVLFRETNDAFRDRLFQVIDEDLVIQINRGGPDANPSWVTDLNGFKIEEWQPHPSESGNPNWWNYFYGRRNWGAPMGYGYEYAERALHPHGVDEREGWDLTYLQVFTRLPAYDDPDYRQRMIRYGIGTAMLGDGFFAFTENERDVAWLPEYDWDFGQPIEDFQREVVGGDTLYVRRFDEGTVEVNPYQLYLSGIPPNSARFSFWLTIENMIGESNAPDSVTLRWPQPVGEENLVYISEVRQATYPITVDNWDTCQLTQGRFTLPEDIGDEITKGAGGLEPNTAYYFAAKNNVYGRLEPGISNVVSITTPPAEEPDTEEPAAIGDLEAAEVNTASVTLTWTAPGDDANEGTADHYVARYRNGGAITTEQEWNQATPIAGGLPTPGPAGTGEELQVSGLMPETIYGFAVRAVDEAGNQGGLSNALAVSTGSVMPGPISDLAVTASYTAGFDLAWTASGDDGEEGQATSYVLGLLEGTSIDNEADWIVAEHITAGLPVPSESGTGQTFELRGLEPETTYGLCLRAYDELGNLSPLGNSPVGTTEALPDVTPPGKIEDLVATPETYRVELEWTAVGDDGVTGTAAAYELGWNVGGPITTEEDWEQAQKTGFDLPDPAPAGTPQSMWVENLEAATVYGFCLRAVDEAANMSPLSPPQTVTTLDSPPLDTEPPAPIDDLATAALTDGFMLEWTAVGDDGHVGTATSYALGYLEGALIESETDWSMATLVTAGLPIPQPVGTTQTYRLEGLADSTVYGLALRAVDDAGNYSPLGTAHSDTTLAATGSGTGPDTDPPMSIDDLTAVSAYSDGFFLQWTSPGDDGDTGNAAFYILGVLSNAPIEDDGDWEAATLRSSELPVPTPAGSIQWCRIRGLDAGATYGLSLRAYDESGNLSPIGQPVTATTLTEDPDPTEDTIAPAPIDDLLAVEEYEDGFVLSWTAVGDDDYEGIAERYRLGVLVGEAIESEAEWSAAEKIDSGLPPAGPAGIGQAYRVRGLAPETTYGLALRAEDDAGNWSDLGTPLLAVTLPDSGSAPGGQEDMIPPGAITNIELEGASTTWADIAWVCSGDDGTEGRAESFILGVLDGEALATEEDWEAARKISAGLPTPLDPGTRVTHRLEGLSPSDTVTLAVRAYDDAERISPLGATLTLTTSPPPDLTPPGAVTDLAAEVLEDNTVRLTWTAAGDDGHQGSGTAYIIALSEGQAITTQAGFEAADRTEHEVGHPAGTPVSVDLSGLPTEVTLGFAVCYRDDVGLTGAVSNSPTVFLDELQDPEPNPDQIEPAPVADLRAVELGTDFVRIAWTATGDDSTSGRAFAYRLGILAGEPLGPGDWESATIETLNASPAEAGSAETYLLSGLTPGERYGIALRVSDEAGNESPTSNAIFVELSTPHVPTPPQAVSDLTVSRAGPGWLELTWTAPASQEPPGPVTEYEFSFARVPITEGNYPNLLRASPPPTPEEPGTTQRFRLGPIRHGENYWIAMRSRDAAGNWSAVSNVAVGTTLEEDLIAPPAPSMPTAEVLRGKEDEGIWVTWLPVQVEDIAGYYIYGRGVSDPVPVRLHDELIEHCAANEVVPGRLGWPIDPPAGGEQFMVSVVAVDESGNESLASDEVALFAEEVQLLGPFPHPIIVPPGGQPAEFRLILPPMTGGEVEIELRIFSVSGELVRSRWGQGYPYFAAGASVPLLWDTTNDRGQRVAPGLYFLELRALGNSVVRKIYVKRD